MTSLSKAMNLAAYTNYNPGYARFKKLQDDIKKAIEQRELKIDPSAIPYPVPGILRSEFTLATQQNIDFQLIKNDADSPTATEILLRDTDAFRAFQISVQLYTHDPSATPAETLYTNNLYTWPNPRPFGTTGEAANLYGLYRGKFNLKINSTEFYRDSYTEQFLEVPVTQSLVYQEAPATDTTGATRWLADSKKWTDAGFVDAIPELTFGGNDITDVNIKLPASIDMAPDSGTRINTAVLFLKGFLVQNGSSILSNAQR